MCVRLYPDVIVAAEINNAQRFMQMYTGSKEIQDVDVSIDDCLLRQVNYKSIGVCNVFVGYEDKDWSEDDYKMYMDKLPQYFIPTENGYRINLAALQGDSAQGELTHQLCDKLFIMGTYPHKVLVALGLR